MQTKPHRDQPAADGTGAIETFNRKMSAEGRPFRLVHRPPDGPVGANAASYELRSEHGDTFDVCCRIADLAPADAVAAAEAHLRGDDAGATDGGAGSGSGTGTTGPDRGV
jgi:hypothetical protein